MAFLPYPTEAGLGDAVQLVIDAVHNRLVDYKEAAHAAWHIAGFGLSCWDVHAVVSGATKVPKTDDEIAAALETLKPRDMGVTPKAAIPWMILLPILLDLIQRFLLKAK